jgi:hypothetical protein
MSAAAVVVVVVLVGTAVPPVPIGMLTCDGPLGQAVAAGVSHLNEAVSGGFDESAVLVTLVEVVVTSAVVGQRGRRAVTKRLQT